MMNVEKPRKTSSGSIHQLSFRWVVPKPPLCSGTSIEDILTPSNQKVGESLRIANSSADWGNLDFRGSYEGSPMHATAGGRRLGSRNCRQLESRIRWRRRQPEILHRGV